MTAYWPPYAEDFRGFPACSCQVEWIPAFERHCNRVIPGFVGTFGIAQLIGTFSGSGGTHGDPGGEGLRKGGGVSDLWVFGKMADLVVAEARKAGADPTWHRQAGWDGPGSDEHVHSVLRGDVHLSTSALVQVACVDRNDDGLAGDAPDSGPRPLSGRTWREGIEWMEEQEMADYAAQLDRIEKQGEASKRRDVSLRKAIKALADEVEAAVEKGDVTLLARVTKAKREVLAAIAEDDE